MKLANRDSYDENDLNYRSVRNISSCSLKHVSTFYGNLMVSISTDKAVFLLVNYECVGGKLCG